MSIILSPEKILAEKLLETLCTGVIACKLAQKLCSLIDGSIEKPKVNARATQGTFFARDNAANFLAWCRKLGVRKKIKIKLESEVVLGCFFGPLIRINQDLFRRFFSYRLMIRY